MKEKVLKNWSTGDTKAVKSWLNISNYRKFEDTTLNGLYHELWARALLFKPLPMDEEKIGLGEYMRQIFNGKPFLFEPENLNYMHDDQTRQILPFLFIISYCG